jgi:hypothetical protein
MRKRYVMRDGELVEKTGESRVYSQQNQALSDIKPFVTQDGTEISSRSTLREYEKKHGVRQTGNDWTGTAPPAFWDMHLARQRGSTEEP